MKKKGGVASDRLKARSLAKSMNFYEVYNEAIKYAETLEKALRAKMIIDIKTDEGEIRIKEAGMSSEVIWARFKFTVIGEALI